MTDLALSTPLWLAVLAVVVNALVGALHGFLDEHRPWDVVGVVTFALLMGLGGGVLRDLLVGVAPQSLRSPWPVVAVLLAVPLARAVSGGVVRVPRLLGALDALALALFAITGAATAVDHGLPIVPAVLVGVVAAVGGGVLVSVLRGEVPTVLQPSRPQALTAAGAALAYLALARVHPEAAYVGGICVAVVAQLLLDHKQVSTRSVTAVRAAD